jgi:hypothetical protein
MRHSQELKKMGAMAKRTVREDSTLEEIRTAYDATERLDRGAGD